MEFTKKQKLIIMHSLGLMGAMDEAILLMNEKMNDDVTDDELEELFDMFNETNETGD